MELFTESLSLDGGAVTRSPGVAGYVAAAQAFSWFDNNFNLSVGTPQLCQPKGTQLSLQHGLFWGQRPALPDLLTATPGEAPGWGVGSSTGSRQCHRTPEQDGTRGAFLGVR